MQDAIAIFTVLLGFLGSLSPCLAADAQDPNRPSSLGTNPALGIVKSIEFEGNHHFKAHVLRERLGFQLGDRLDFFLAEGGKVTLEEAYRKVGYPHVKVTLDPALRAEGRLLYLIEEGPRVQVSSIRFVGNGSFSTRTLRQVVKTKRRKWLLWPTYFTEDAIKEDTDRLQTFYYNQGFLNHKIAARTEYTGDGTKMRVLFLIEEGPIYHVAEIAFTGQTLYTAEQLRAQVKVREGDVYKKPKVDRDAREVVQLYREQGYVDALVQQSGKFLPESEDFLVKVTFEVREGRQFRIGQVDITGNDVTKDKAVRRILDEYGFTPGELYNAKIAPREGGGQLEKYIQRGILTDQAVIRPVNSASGDPNSRDARVDVKEGMTGLIRPGVGFSSDSGVIGQLIYQQGNFDIADGPENLSEFLFPWKAWRGGGQRFTVRLEPGTRYSTYSVNFVDPYWNDQPITLDVLGWNRKWFRESYDEDRLKGAFEFEQRLEDYWRRSIGFRAENVRVSDLDFDAPQEIRDVRGDNQLYGVKFGVGKTTLDDLYDPTQGWRARGSYEQLTGDFTFGLLEGAVERFVTVHEDVLGRRTVLKGKVLAATTVGDAPPFEKFHGGGTGHYGIRGFEYRGVSTRGFQVIDGVPTSRKKDPIGSDWIFLAGTELIVPLIGPNFNAVFFLDSGTVDTGSYRLSTGFGIEIKVPQLFGNMPMRFELGFPLLKSEGDETQVFSFSGGGFF